jgi:predicted nucleotidyltransferase
VSLPDVSARVGDAIVAILRDVFAERLQLVAIHGSAATGDLLAGLSDFDIAVVVKDGVTVDDTIEIHRKVEGLDIGPFSYLQPAFFEASRLTALLIPGAFAVLLGTEPPPGLLQTDEDLRNNGEAWLVKLPTLVRSDGQAWALATGDTTKRMARLLVTRLKPALRGLMVRNGVVPAKAWSASWAAIAASVHASDPELGRRVRRLLDAAADDSDHRWRDVGDRALSALEYVVTSSGSTALDLTE